MTRPPAPRWALSPLDHKAHLLLPEGGYSGVLAAYCGHLLPTVATVHDQPPDRGRCTSCDLIFQAETSPPRLGWVQAGGLLNPETPSGRRFLSVPPGAPGGGAVPPPKA